MVTGFSVDEMKPIHDTPATDYMRACLTDEFVGCAFVGKASDMKYSVTGRAPIWNVARSRPTDY